MSRNIRIGRHKTGYFMRKKVKYDKLQSLFFPCRLDTADVLSACRCFYLERQGREIEEARCRYKRARSQRTSKSPPCGNFLGGSGTTCCGHFLATFGLTLSFSPICRDVQDKKQFFYHLFFLQYLCICVKACHPAATRLRPGPKIVFRYGLISKL